MNHFQGSCNIYSLWYGGGSTIITTKRSQQLAPELVLHEQPLPQEVTGNYQPRKATGNLFPNYAGSSGAVEKGFLRFLGPQGALSVSWWT